MQALPTPSIYISLANKLCGLSILFCSYICTNLERQKDKLVDMSYQVFFTVFMLSDDYSLIFYIVK